MDPKPKIKILIKDYFDCKDYQIKNLEYGSGETERLKKTYSDRYQYVCDMKLDRIVKHKWIGQLNEKLKIYSDKYIYVAYAEISDKTHLFFINEALTEILVHTEQKLWSGGRVA